MQIDTSTKRKILFWAVGAPIAVNILMFIPSFGLAALTTDNWLGFFGNYSGGIIGGVVAYIIAAGQIKAQNDKATHDEIESNRSFVILEEFMAKQNLDNIITHPNSKILSNKYYEEIKEDKDFIDTSIMYYKFHQTGLPDIILDVEIRGEFTDENNSPYNIESHLTVLEKGVEIYIPISIISQETIDPKMITVSYMTIKKERILYTYDLKNMVEKHVLLHKDGTQEELFVVEIKPTAWVLPSKEHKVIDIRMKQ